MNILGSALLFLRKYMNNTQRRVYFVGSLSAKDKYGWAYEKIAMAFRERGYFVWDDVNIVDWNLAQNLNDSEMKQYQTGVLKRIRNCDIFVAEISYPSSSIGYEIGYAVAQSKPILLLRSDDLKNKPGSAIRGNNSNLLNLLTYNQNNLVNQINKFLKKAQKGIFAKRLPIEFTQGQVDFIEKLQSINKKSFNATVREIIDNAINEDN